MHRLFSLVSLCLVSLCLVSCAPNPATGGYNFSLVTPKEQREIGDTTATATLAAEGVYRPTSAATLYVNDLCNRIYAVTEAAAEPVQCNLIDTGEVNAFATPGYLSFHRGLLAFMSSEDELASVIGHEAGHLTSRHVARSVTSGRVTDLLVMGTVATVAATTPVPDPATMQGLGSLGQEAGTLGRMSFSRDYEREADALGRRYMQAAGFVPTGSVAAQQAMLLYNGYMEQRLQAAFGGEKASVLDRLKSSHPPSQERLDTARKDAGDAPLATMPDAGRTRYMQAIEGVAFGPARRYGIARQSELVLTRERVVLPLPAGATTEYLSSGSFDDLGTWLIGHPQSGTYVRLNAYKSVTGRSPAATLAQLLPALNSGVQRMAIGQPVLATSEAEGDDDERTSTDEDTSDRLADAAAEDLGKLPHREVIGYTATYRYLNSPKRFRVVAFETATRRNKMMVLTAIYPNEETMQREDANLMSILKNVRFLTRTEALKYKQLYLHSFTAATGETVAQKAAHLPVGAYQEPLFRALNNLPEGQDLQPGQLYKTIIDPNT
jgi:predicted Zn-dependent protease